jgi:hypothetical protein
MGRDLGRRVWAWFLALSWATKVRKSWQIPRRINDWITGVAKGRVP